MRGLWVLLVLAPTAAPASGDFGGCAEGTLGLVEVRSAETRVPGLVAVSLTATAFESRDASDELAAGVGHYGTLRLAASAGVTAWLEVSADGALARAAWDGVDAAEGLLSPGVTVKLRAPFDHPWLRVAAEARAELPGGSDLRASSGAGEVALLGDEPDATAMLLVTADLTRRFPARLHLNAGWAFHRSDDAGRRLFPDVYPAVSEGGSAGDNDALLLRGAVEFPGRRVTLFTEFRGDLLRDRSLVAAGENPFTLTPGVRARLGAWTATAALSVALSADDADTPDFDPVERYPDWAVTTSLSWGWDAFAADSDGDGVPDHRDGCPGAAEDRDGFEDADGCPDPDNDGDGIGDAFDFEPLAAEDLDGFEDWDGAPDPDNDGDGIPDADDMCPDAAEDFDGYEDADGCPDR
jgi:hypothetical protein